MRCYCCDAVIALARKVKLRVWRNDLPVSLGPGSLAYHSYQEDMTFRWAFVCETCYCGLDNDTGVGEAGRRLFGLAGAARGGRAAVVDEAKYRAFQRRLAARMGLAI